MPITKNDWTQKSEGMPWDSSMYAICEMCYEKLFCQQDRNNICASRQQTQTSFTLKPSCFCDSQKTQRMKKKYKNWRKIIILMLEIIKGKDSTQASFFLCSWINTFPWTDPSLCSHIQKHYIMTVLFHEWKVGSIVDNLLVWLIFVERQHQ